MRDDYGPPSEHDDLWLTEKTAQAYPDPWTTVVPRPKKGPAPIAGQETLFDAPKGRSSGSGGNLTAEGFSAPVPEAYARLMPTGRPFMDAVCEVPLEGHIKDPGPIEYHREAWPVYRMTEDGVEPVDPGLGLGPFDNEEE